jgi:hypothetical protein
MTRAPGTDPLGALRSAMTLSSMDWGAAPDMAWILRDRRRLGRPLHDRDLPGFRLVPG